MEITAETSANGNNHTKQTKIDELKAVRKQQETRMTVLLVGHSVAKSSFQVVILTSFIIFNVPITTVNIWFYSDEQTYKTFGGPDELRVRRFTAPINLLLTCNYSLNFYLYCLANRCPAKPHHHWVAQGLQGRLGQPAPQHGVVGAQAEI